MLKPPELYAIANSFRTERRTLTGIASHSLTCVRQPGKSHAGSSHFELSLAMYSYREYTPPSEYVPVRLFPGMLALLWWILSFSSFFNLPKLVYCKNLYAATTSVSFDPLSLVLRRSYTLAANCSLERARMALNTADVRQLTTIMPL